MELRERGWSIRGAAKEVGVSRTSGNNWARGYKTYRRGEVVGFVPALERLAVRQISPRFLSQDERIEIADLRQAGLGVRAIAARLGRSPSTICRELRRNGSGRHGYRPFEAHRQATARRAGNHRRRIHTSPSMLDAVAGLLGSGGAQHRSAGPRFRRGRAVDDGQGPVPRSRQVRPAGRCADRQVRCGRAGFGASTAPRGGRSRSVADPDGRPAGMAADSTRAINSLTALARTASLGIDARRALTDADVNTVARWRARPGEPLAIATGRAEAIRLAGRVVAFRGTGGQPCRSRRPGR